MSRMLCVECGALVPRLIGGSCTACFTSRTQLLVAPHVLDVEVCAHCDARHVGAHWIDPDEGMPLEQVRQASLQAVVKAHAEVRNASLDVVERVLDERNFEQTVRLTGAVDDVPVEAEVQVLIRMKRGVCDRCSRMFGGYYAAIIQFRATDRDVRESEIDRAHQVVGDELDRMRATGNREAFLTKSGPVPGGFDYYLGDIEGTRIIAKAVAAKLGATVAETAKLAGRKEGNDLYRVTFLVRMPLFANGDLALLEDDVVQVNSQDKGIAIVTHLLTRRRDKVDDTRLKRLGGPDILQEAVVVSEDAQHLQVLDPESFKTVDLPRPPGYTREDARGAAEGTIWIVRHEERMTVPAFLPHGFPPPVKVRKPKNRIP